MRLTIRDALMMALSHFSYLLGFCFEPRQLKSYKKDNLYDQLASSQEEADSKIILHAIGACRKGATKIDIH